MQILSIDLNKLRTIIYFFGNWVFLFSEVSKLGVGFL